MKQVLAMAICSVALCASADASVAIVDNIGGSFVDISGSGTALSLSDDGEVDITTTVGNSLLAPGTARVGANGGVRFLGAGAELSFSNSAIPSNGAFSGDQALLPFWDDINTAGSAQGEIYWQEIGSTLYVQWDNVQFFASSLAATFQVQVFSTGPNVAQFIYADVEQSRPDSGASATIGYQDGGFGENDFQWSFNTASVSNGAVLTVVHSPAPVPEPTTFAIWSVLGGLGLAVSRYRRRRA